MATVSHSESRRLYSWWWDSHISPKTSKWLQENLTDMDAKVKAMIKLIEEDADSFARRAEMYYKKRPELMKLVEEFYRAYRALAERYDCATVELRQVHKTMAEAFPNQVPFMLAECSPSDSSPSETEPQTPEMPHPIRALLDPDELHDDALGLSSAYLRTLRSNETCTDDSRFKISKKRLRQISGGTIPLGMPEDLDPVADGKEQSCQYEPPLLSNGNQNLPVVAESDHKSKAESHEHTLKEALAEIKAEKEALFIQYQKSIERLAILDRELNHAQDDVRTFAERAYKAENEVRTLREVLVTLEAERDAGILQLKTSSKKISDLETVLSLSQRDTEVLKERAIKAEAEAQSWKLELPRLEGEKKAAILQYTQCLEKVNSLEDKILHVEAEARKLFEQADRAEIEVKVLKQALTDSNEEKEATAVQYKKCLENISKMESELACAHSDAERLNSEILVGMNKLKDSEEHCIELEKSNQSLQLEVDNVAKKMVMKDQELLEKHEELVKLQVCVQYEHSRLLQAEGTLQTLQNMHSQSQEDHRALVWEVQNGLQLLKDSEKCKQELEREIQRINRENQSLNDLNLSSSILIRDMQNEAFNLRKTKGKHEEKVAEQLDQIKTLQRDIYHLKEEIKSLNRRYQALLDQLESVGLNPESLALSVKALQDEIANLKDFCKRDRDEKDDLLRKLEEMGILSEKNSVLERSLIDLTSELEGARQNTKSLQESYQILRGEKSNLVAEKSSLFSQLLISSENMQKLLEKNSRMEESLCASNIKLEGLREKSKGLEESCHLLNNEKSSLLTERETLVSQLKIVEERLGNLEKKLTVLEESYAGLEKEKEFRIHQVDELHASLATEKQERADFMFSSETRFVGLENQMHLLQKESISRQKEFEEELDRAVDAQVEIFILKKCVHDMEEKNFSLMMECHKYIETTKLSEKIISELEIENLEQQVELEFLLDEIEKLKTGIYNIFKALQTDSELDFKKDIKVEQTIVPQINRNIKNMKSSLLRIENEKQQLSVENTVLFTLIEELRLEGGKLDSENKAINQEFKCLELQCGAVQNDKMALQDLNEQLNVEVNKHDQQEKSLKTERGELIEKLVSLQEDNHELQKGNSKAIEENKYLLKGLSELKQDICLLEEENGYILLEAIFLGNLSLIYNCFGTEKTTELDALAENIDILNWTNSDLRNDVKVFEKKMEIKEIENYHLMDSVEKLKTELYETKSLNVQLNHQVVAADDLLSYKHKTFSEVEEKLKCAQNLNLELCSTLEGMEREHWESELTREILVVQMLDISKHGSDQHKVIECLREVNESLETEMMVLHRQIDECKLREENLSSELQEKSSEFELWEAEASKFYFDLQISTVREVLFEDKVHELTSVCVGVEAETASKSADLVHMKERVSSLEGELGGLRMQLSAYDASIYSLKDNIASLENNFLLCKSQCLRNDQKDVEVIAYVHGQNCNHHEDQSVEVTDGISDLKNMQVRIKAVEEELKKLPTQVDIDTTVKLEAAMNEIEELKSSRFYQTKSSQEGRSLEDVFHGDFDLQETELGRNKILMKDISLDRVSSCSFLRESKEGNAGVDDQMLALWETDEQDKRAPVAHDTQNQEVLMKPQFEDVEQQTGNAAAGVELEQDLSIDKEEVSTRVVESRVDENERNILERLAADAQKLQSLHITVQELKRKMEANKKSKKRKVIDYETMEEQLQETEDVVSELVDINAQLTKNIEETPSSSNRRDSAELEQAGRADISEIAQKGSEKIGRLQLEVLKIQYVLLKLDDEKKKSSRSSEIRINRSTALFKGLIYSGGKSDGRKKGCFCGCLRPSSPDGNQGNHI